MDRLPHREILAATANLNKVTELQAAARNFGITLRSLREVEQERGLLPPPLVEETADSYRGNALLKARAYAEWSGMAALGDDSGLEVSILNGRPGIYSSEYLGKDATYPERMAGLLAEVQAAEKSLGKRDRAAIFRCTLILSLASGALYQSEGVLHGEILDEPRGNQGFGYDPLVLITSIGKTLAEIEPEITHRIGHRALAVQNLFSQPFFSALFPD